MAKLTREQYYEWKMHIALLWNAENKEIARKYQLESMNKDAQICALKASVFRLKDVLDSTRDKDEARKEYEGCKKRIEDSLGISLNGVTIDEVTLEVISQEQGGE